MIRPGGRGRALWFMICWFAIGLGSFVLGVMLETGQRVEDTVLDAADFTTTPPPPLNLVSIPSVAVAIIAVGVIALFSFGIRRAVLVTVVPALAIVASQLLKQTFLTRPQLLEIDAPNTFPSGHMTVFTVVIIALVFAVPERIRAAVTVLGALVLSAVNWQLLAYGWHRPSDIYGALALGVLGFSIASLISPARTSSRITFGRGTVVTLAIIASVFIVVAALAVVVALARTNDHALLVAGACGGAGLSFFAARAALMLSAGRS